MNLHRLEVPTPFQVGTVNVYLLDGPPLTLLDCGPNTDETYVALTAGLQQHGVALHAIEQVVISHHHVDHVGLIHRVISESGAALLAHEYAVPYLQTPSIARQRDNDFLHTICHEGGVPAWMMATIEKVTRWVERFVNAPMTVDRVVTEGDTIQIGEQEWCVYHTPGHAGDMICLYNQESQTLLSSDHLLLAISSNPLIEPSPISGTPRPRRLPEYLQHLQRIADLHPRIAYPGHGKPIEDVVGLVDERLEFHHQRAAKVLSYFDEGSASLWEITEKMFGHIQQQESKFLAISEVLGHIDLLETAGALQRSWRGGVVRWHRTQ